MYDINKFSLNERYTNLYLLQLNVKNSRLALQLDRYFISYLPLYRTLFGLRLNCTCDVDGRGRMILCTLLVFHPNMEENNKGDHVIEVSLQLLYFARFQVSNQMILNRLKI